MPDDDSALSSGTVELRQEERRAANGRDLGLPAVSWDDDPPRFLNVTCPTCRGTGGGAWNDCPTCDGNGVVA